jgi:hypothetical protein
VSVTDFDPYARQGDIVKPEDPDVGVVEMLDGMLAALPLSANMPTATVADMLLDLRSRAGDN